MVDVLLLLVSTKVDSKVLMGYGERVEEDGEVRSSFLA